MIILTTFIGVLLSANKKKRMTVYAELYEFNERLILNLKYEKVRMQKIVYEYKYVSEIFEGKEVLSGKDKEFIDGYVNNIGSTDALSQIDYLNEKKIYLKKYKDDSLNDYKKYGALYVKIFFMVGILIAVLLA